MFCYQCEQTAKGVACDSVGVCGKSAETSDLQDLLVYVLRGLSVVAVAGRKVGVIDPEVDRFVCEGLFSTLTNVNFDAKRLRGPHCTRPGVARGAQGPRGRGGRPGGLCPGSGELEPRRRRAPPGGPGRRIRAGPRPTGDNADVKSLQHLVLFGLRGVAAYADHARILGQEDEAVHAAVHEGLAALYEDLDLNAWVAQAMKVGEDQPARHGAPGRRQHRGLRASRAHRGSSGGQGRQGNPGLGA